MHYDLLKPCDNCPFLRKGGVRLHQERVREIAGAMMDSQGSTFACHKTTINGPDDDGEADLVAGPKSKQCAGGLIFAEKQGTANQMTRIMERLGLYDSRKLMKDEKVVASVFDTLDEMLEANEEG